MYTRTLDLDALLEWATAGAEGFDADKINTITSGVIGIAAGPGWSVNDVLAVSVPSRGAGTTTIRRGNLPTSTRCWRPSCKSAQFSASVDQLQQLVSGLARTGDPIAGAISPLASADGSYGFVAIQRRPLQNILEDARAWLPVDNRRPGP